MFGRENNVPQLELRCAAWIDRITGGTAALLGNGDVLAYGNHFSCYAAQYFSPLTNVWARMIGQCGNSVSNGPLVLLETGKVLLAGERSFTAVMPLPRFDARSTIHQRIPGRLRAHCYKPHGERRRCLALARYCPSAVTMRRYTRLRNEFPVPLRLVRSVPAFVKGRERTTCR